MKSFSRMRWEDENLWGCSKPVPPKPFNTIMYAIFTGVYHPGDPPYAMFSEEDTAKAFATLVLHNCDHEIKQVTVTGHTITVIANK